MKGYCNCGILFFIAPQPKTYPNNLNTTSIGKSCIFAVC